MKVEFYYDSDLIKTVEATCIPCIGEAVYMEPDLYEVEDVCYTYDKNLVQISLTDR